MNQENSNHTKMCEGIRCGRCCWNSHWESLWTLLSLLLKMLNWLKFNLSFAVFFFFFKAQNTSFLVTSANLHFHAVCCIIELNQSAVFQVSATRKSLWRRLERHFLPVSWLGFTDQCEDQDASRSPLIAAASCAKRTLWHLLPLLKKVLSIHLLRALNALWKDKVSKQIRWSEIACETSGLKLPSNKALHLSTFILSYQFN